MSSYAERQRIMAEIRQKAGEAAIAHTMSDQESELAMLGLGLADEQEQLERLWDEDTFGMVAFGDDDAWVDKRLKRRGA
jgi:hypothetical protein